MERMVGGDGEGVLLVVEGFNFWGVGQGQTDMLEIVGDLGLFF